MGLDTTHDCFHGAYSSFGIFRKSLAWTCGFDLLKMEGFTDIGYNWDFLDIPKGARALLSHSDCDGKLTVEECVDILIWLEAVTLIDDYQENQRVLFVAGLKKAIAAKEEVEFH